MLWTLSSVAFAIALQTVGGSAPKAEEPQNETVYTFMISGFG